MSRRHAKQAQTRLDRLSFVQPDMLRSLHSLAADMDALQSGVSTLPPIDPTNADMPGLEPGKRQWEIGKTGFLNWARAQLIQHAQRAPGRPVLSGASAEEANPDTSRKDVTGALQEHERDD